MTKALTHHSKPWGCVVVQETLPFASRMQLSWLVLRYCHSTVMSLSPRSARASARTVGGRIDAVERADAASARSAVRRKRTAERDRNAAAVVETVAQVRHPLLRQVRVHRDEVRLTADEMRARDQVDRAVRRDCPR